MNSLGEVRSLNITVSYKDKVTQTEPPGRVVYGIRESWLEAIHVPAWGCTAWAAPRRVWDNIRHRRRRYRSIRVPIECSTQAIQPKQVNKELPANCINQGTQNNMEQDLLLAELPNDVTYRYTIEELKSYQRRFYIDD